MPKRGYSSSSGGPGTAYGSRRPAKRSKSAPVGGRTKKKYSFAKKVKSIVLRQMETKMTNQVGIIDIKHNEFTSHDEGALGSANEKRCFLQNMTGCVQGDTSRTRDGMEVHSMDVRIKGMLYLRNSMQTNDSGTTHVPSRTMYCRIIVCELDRSDGINLTTGTPSGFITDPKLLPNDNIAATMINTVNRDYKVLYDQVISVTNNQSNDTGAVTNDLYTWPNQKYIDIKIPINKKLVYDKNAFTPSKSHHFYICAYDSENDVQTNGHVLGKAHLQVFHRFKDV
jgi:hypothetical protein